MIMTKIKVKIKLKDSNSKPELSSEQLDNPEKLVNDIGITKLIKICQRYNVIVRGDPVNICQTLKKKLYGNKYLKDHGDIIGRTFIRYLLWHLGQCHLLDKSSNDEDFYTSVPVRRIPECYLFMCQTHGKAHGFDIRSLVSYREIGNNFRHPYTDRPFTDTELQRIDSKVRWLKRLGYQTKHKLTITEPSTRQSVEQLTINVFASINEHQYVDYMWYMQLSPYYLVQLYYELHEIWTYRLPMQASHKEQITKYPIFSNWDNVKNYQPSMESKLRIELLKNMQHLVGDGVTEDHRKTGCYIFMLGLVLVSEDAATSNPSLYQAAYYEP